MKKHLWAAAAALSLAGCASVPTPEPAPLAGPLKKPDLDRIVVAESAAPPQDFPAFLGRAAKAYPALQSAVAAYGGKVPMSQADLVQVARLLGLYNRLRHQQAVIDTTARMVAIPTVRSEKTAPHDDPAIIAFGALVEGLARDFGLQYRNVDNRIFEVRLPGTGPEEFGILTHADVVPVVASEWVLEDGTRLDPFKLTRVGGNLYGRGSIDDKGSIAAVLYAMRTVKESGLPLSRGIRLMIETTEETGGDAMKYYRAKTALPEYNIVLDSKYPAVVAEKGSGALRASFALQPGVPAAADAATVTAMAGAASTNAVPQTATARLQAADAQALAARLEAAREGFIARYTGQGGPFRIAVQPEGQTVAVTVTGASAHGSRPEEGVNPLPRLALFLGESGVPLAANGYGQAVRYLVDLYGLDYLGRTMGLAYSDDFMGPLTLSPNLVREKDGKVDVLVNVRMPRGSTPEALAQATTAKIQAWGAQAGIAVEVDHQQGNWMARDPRGAWLGALLDTFGATTGLPAQPVSTAGSTTAKLMPNAINFGPAMPGKKYTAHNAREFKEVADLDADMQMFTEMLVRIGNLPAMQ
ncbi:dipeptidase [Acidovorax sp. NCPPB 4044]|uniref:dipeptidase n=1 Tax=Acidovorax sp. NCPPB 4044 TaxID=2940490 RepID=UPI002302F835|nr:dipeptidase [Acidovorax sp. NCPPB 4044]MDA8522785.1 dipeptidase [Acidovorax sp. NCPPB 4044]